MIPERFNPLPDPTWPRLRALLDAHPAGREAPINMTIGEPKHPFPDWLPDMLGDFQSGWGSYPDNNGMPKLRSAICDWIQLRYGVGVDADSQVMVLNGTREGLYNGMMALCPEDKNGTPAVLIPNPFYPAYPVGALSIGAEAVYMPTTLDSGHLPDFRSLSPDVLNRTAIAILCSPANPQGKVADDAYWKDLLELAERYDIRIFSDECYSEIYRDAPPPGGLEMAQKYGADPERVTIFHSLSKRSNLPGLRSGFVAGGPKNISAMKRLRAGGGSPVPNPIQEVSAAVWADEAHVVANRQQYLDKFDIADHIFAGFEGYESPEAGFFLWLPVQNGEATALRLWRDAGVRTLPGAYLSTAVNGVNPGQDYIRVALVAPKEEMTTGLELVRAHLG